ncbi:29776_t:CDS:1, partial [Racocetra persica]
NFASAGLVIVSLNEAKDSISDIADPTQKTVDMLEANLLALQQELSSKSDLIENLTSETELVAELRSRLEALKLDINSKHELIEEMRKDLSDKNNIQQQLLDKESEATTLRLQLSEIMRREEEIQKQIKELQETAQVKEQALIELNLLKKEFGAKKEVITTLEGELQETTQAKEQALTELNLLKKDFGAQKELVITIEGELKQVREELTKSKQDNQEASKKLEDLSKLLSDTLKQRDEGENRIQVLEIQLQELSASNETNDQEASILREELFNAKHKMSAQNQLLAELGTQMMAAEQERDQYFKREKELIMELEAKETEQKVAIATLESIISSLREELVEAKTSSQMDLETIVKLRDNLATVELQLDEAKKQEESRSKVVIGLEVKLKETNAAILEKEQLLSTKDALLKELEASTEKAKIQLDNARISEAIECERVNELEVKLCGIQTKLRECVSSDLVMELEVTVVNPDDLSTKAEYVELKASLVKVKAELEEARAAAAEQTNLIKTLELQIQEAEKRRDEASSKVKDAAEEINKLKEQCINLQSELDDAYKDALIHGFQKVDISIVEDLNKQLRKARNESKAYQERVDKLEEMNKKLESDKKGQEKTNEELLKQVERLQKEIETLAGDFADSTIKYGDTGELLQKQKKQIDGLDNSLIEMKNLREVYSSPTSDASLSDTIT